MSVIGFIGTGELALYTIKGLRGRDYKSPILLSPRNHEIANLLQRDFDCEVMSDNQAVVDQCDYPVIATRPPDCLDALSELQFRPGQVLISVVAGVTIEQLRSVVPADLEIVRVMPVSSAAVGASPTVIYPHNEFVVEIFDLCGKSIVVEHEEHFNQSSILACVYSWFFELYDHLIEATSTPDLPPEITRELVMGMAAGAARLALDTGDMSPREIARHIATDGTYSKLGLDLLTQQDAFEPWQDACKLLQRRLAGSD